MDSTSILDDSDRVTSESIVTSDVIFEIEELCILDESVSVGDSVREDHVEPYE